MVLFFFIRRPAACLNNANAGLALKTTDFPPLITPCTMINLIQLLKSEAVGRATIGGWCDAQQNLRKTQKILSTSLFNLFFVIYYIMLILKKSLARPLTQRISVAYTWYSEVYFKYNILCHKTLNLTVF